MFSFWKKSSAASNSTNQQSSAKPIVKPFPDIQDCTPAWKDNDVWKVPMKNPKTECECREIQDSIFDLIKTIKDPEKPSTLEELNVITEDSVMVQPLPNGEEGYQVRVDFNPTVPHCSLASLIGLCIRSKIQRHFAERMKVDIVIAEGMHSTEEEINKQINDKERVAAALENPALRDMVETCITENE